MEMDEAAHKIMQLEIEETALKKEDDKLSAEQLESVRKELSEQRDEFPLPDAQGDAVKHLLRRGFVGAFVFKIHVLQRNLLDSVLAGRS